MKTIWGAWLVALAACDLVSGGPPEAEPPPPAQPATLPEAYAATLPKDDSGRPIVLSFGAMGTGIEVVHDATLDDPIARWGECMGRVAGCYRTNVGRDPAGCVLAIPHCAGNEGGMGCCPGRCIDDFERAYDEHEDTLRALGETIMTGECVEGVPVEVSP